MNKGRMTSVEMYCIKQKELQGETAEQIAEFLNRTVDSIKRYMTKVKVADATEEDNHQKKKKKNSTLFIRETSAKREKNAVSIMTTAESERSDDTRLRNQSKITNRYKSVIHSIQEDEDG